MTLDDWERGGAHTAHRGHSIFYREEGNGDALLCIHGFPTASWDWHRVWPALVQRFRAIAPDLIGFGFSAKPRRHPYSIFDQADLCEGLLRSRGVSQTRILAHDYGDTVAQELLARFAERRRKGDGGIEIKSVAFLNGGLFPEVHRARFVQKLLHSPLGPVLALLQDERRFARAFAPVFGPRTRPSREEMSDFWRLVSREGGARIAHKLIRYIAERRRFRERWVGALRSGSVRLRFINGPEDPVSGGHMAERYRELVPRADVVILEGIGHYPQVEDPQGVLRALSAFWDGGA